MKKFIFILILFVLNFCFINTVNAENFEISYYEVNLNVNKDKSVNVTETINTYFTVSSHGIYRDIPIKGKDKITDIGVNERYSVFEDTNNVRIKIGDPDKYIYGPKKYKINYTYHIRDNKDEFYFNIIGDKWGTKIYNANFEIKLPAPVDPDKVGLSIGGYGSRGFKDNAIYYVNGNKITGKTLETLPPNNGITIRIEVPHGYFEPYKLTLYERIIKPVVMTLIIIFAYIAFIIWFKFGKDKHITPVVTFYPPKNLNSAQVGVIDKEKATVQDILSLIYYLAAKGYIKITDEKRGFKLEKIKDYDGPDKIEAELMDILFWNKTVVLESVLKKSHTFYSKIQDLQKELSEYKKEIFTPESLNWRNKLAIIGCILFTVVLLCFTATGFSLNLESSMPIPFLLLFVTIGTTVFAFTFPTAPPSLKVFITFWALGFAGIPLIALITILFNSNVSILTIALGIVALVVEFICLVNLPQWKDDARRLKSEVLGLKQFIKVAEKHKIEEILRTDPAYCYDLLPFAYAMGLETALMTLIEKLMMANPNWYNGEFTRHSFGNLSNSIYNSSIPSRENGGISSSSGGGGFSGGGCGGGGGGSW